MSNTNGQERKIAAGDFIEVGFDSDGSPPTRIHILAIKNPGDKVPILASEPGNLDTMVVVLRPDIPPGSDLIGGSKEKGAVYNSRGSRITVRILSISADIPPQFKKAKREKVE